MKNESKPDGRGDERNEAPDVVTLLRELTEAEATPCRFDHHGYCQEHPTVWDSKRPRYCSTAAAQAFFRRAEPVAPDRALTTDDYAFDVEVHPDRAMLEVVALDNWFRGLTMGTRKFDMKKLARVAALLALRHERIEPFLAHRNDDEVRCREYEDGPDTCDCGLDEALRLIPYDTIKREPR